MAEMEKGLSCGACHNGKKAFSVAAEKDCSKCHRGTPAPLPIVSLPVMPYSAMIHTSTAKGLAVRAVTKVDQSAAVSAWLRWKKANPVVHATHGKTAFTAAANCGSCHRGLATKTLKYKSKPVNDAVFSHDFHVQAYKCGDCHTKKYDYRQGSRKASMADMAKGKPAEAATMAKLPSLQLVTVTSVTWATNRPT